MEQAVSYQCKVYDKNGRLIKIISPKEMTIRSENKFFEQKSTKRAVARIKCYRDPKFPTSKEKKFFNRFCIVCKKEFFSRHPYTKYCSHECQKVFYINKKALLTKQEPNKNKSQ
tara:strand:+ start:251 stop:592 length:342 start_codon:yes stop_codon:yes gene_type:complete